MSTIRNTLMLTALLGLTLLVACKDETTSTADAGGQDMVADQVETVTVALTSLAEGDCVTGLLVVTADVVGSPTQVDLIVDDAPVQSLTSAPWEFQWDTTTLTEGTHQVWLEAAAPGGETVASDPVNISLDHTAPTVAFAELELPYLFTGDEGIVVNAEDTVGVASVTLMANDTEIATFDQPPFQGTWDTTALPDGEVILAAVATDMAGNTQTAEILGLVVNVGTVVSIVEDDVFTWTIPGNWRAVEYHQKVHFYMPEGMTRLMGVVQWDQPTWQLHLDVGTGGCPHSGTMLNNGEAVGGQLMVTHQASDIELDNYIADQMWFLHIGDGVDLDLDTVVGLSTQVAFIGVVYGPAE